jgi:hypothetical protein
MRRMIFAALATSAMAVATPAIAQITPGAHTVTDVSAPLPPPGTFGQVPGENTGGGSATINSTNVSDTDGSLAITGDRARVQTGVQYDLDGIGTVYPTNTGIAANSLVDLTADYIINSLSAGPGQDLYTPAFRVLLQDGSTRSELIWEGTYNDPANNLGLGAGSADAGDLFWQFVSGCGPTIVGGGCPGSGTYVMHTLADWGDLFGANAFVSGLSLGVGSGAGDVFSANIDNFALTTDAGTASYNFAVADTGAVPEPATWAMMLMGFGGIGFQMRRSRRNGGSLLKQAA